MRIYRTSKHSDRIACIDCRLTGDIWLMTTHICSKSKIKKSKPKKDTNWEQTEQERIAEPFIPKKRKSPVQLPYSITSEQYYYPDLVDLEYRLELDRLGYCHQHPAPLMPMEVSH